MSSYSQSDQDDQPTRQRTQTPSRPDVNQRTQRVHSNLRNHHRRRAAPYAPPLRGSAAAAASGPGGASNGPARTAPSRQESSPPVQPIGTTRNYGGPRGGVTRTWPPTIVPFEISEEHLSDEFIDNMGRAFDLRAPYTEFAEELIQVPEPRQYAILLYSILSVRQSVESLISSRDMALANSMSTTASLSVQARLFSYQRHFRTFVQTRAKEILMDPFLEVYSCDPVRGGPPAGRSLLEQVMDHVRIQSDEFKQDYLPVGFLDRDPAAEASVNSELRDKLKHERGAMRNMLLGMVHSSPGQAITHPVPTLTNLIIDMQSRMLPNSDDNVHADGRVRARIAYLRIQTISHYARPVPGGVNRQWALVDEQLQDLRGKSPAHRRAFFKLILELDAASFGDKFFSELDVESIRPPTELEVMAKMAIIAEENAIGALPPSGSSTR